MRQVAIVTDSVACIPKEMVEKYQGRIQAGPGQTAGAVFRIQIPLDSCGPVAGAQPQTNGS